MCLEETKGRLHAILMRVLREFPTRANATDEDLALEVVAHSGMIGTDLGFGSVFDRFDGSAFVWFPTRRVSPFLSPSLFRGDDRFDGSAFVWFPTRRVSPFLSPSLFAR